MFARAPGDSADEAVIAALEARELLPRRRGAAAAAAAFAKLLATVASPTPMQEPTVAPAPARDADVASVALPDALTFRGTREQDEADASAGDDGGEGGVGTSWRLAEKAMAHEYWGLNEPHSLLFEVDVPGDATTAATARKDGRLGAGPSDGQAAAAAAPCCGSKGCAPAQPVAVTARRASAVSPAMWTGAGARKEREGEREAKCFRFGHRLLWCMSFAHRPAVPLPARLLTPSFAVSWQCAHRATDGRVSGHPGGLRNRRLCQKWTRIGLRDGGHLASARSASHVRQRFIMSKGGRGWHTFGCPFFCLGLRA